MSTRSKVAIVGFSETSRDKAPFDDKAFEIWGCNRLWEFIPRWDRWFDPHPVEWSEAHMTEWAKHRAWLEQSHGRPIYMLQRYDWIPDSIAYPIDLVTAKLGARYFTNAIAYMVAFAILADFEEIHVYGVEMRHDTEYGAQRPCTEFWLGLARGLGRKVVLPSSCGLLNNDGSIPLYGYEEQAGAWAELDRALEERIRELTKAKDGWRAKNEDAVAHMEAHDGAIQEARYLLTRIRQRSRGGPL